MLQWSKLLTILGVVIACANMALAWVIMFQPPEPVQIPPLKNVAASPATKSDVGSSAVTTGERAAGSSGSPFDYASLIEYGAKTAEAQGARSYHINVLVLAFSFALLAIGFSLFVMGVEGAFHAGATASQIGSVTLKMASPGLACILAAAVIIGMTSFLSSDFETAEKARARGVEAEAKAKEDLIRAQADARRDESFAKSNEADAKVRIMDAEARIKENEANRREVAPPNRK